MTGQKVRAVVLLALAALALSRPIPATAQANDAPGPVDPLRFASLPLDPQVGGELPARTWQLTASVTVFNVWAGSWHTGTTHRGLGLRGQPLTREEIHILERDFPHDGIYRIDLEGWRADLVASVGIGRRMAITARLPWVGVGRPHWDAAAERFHLLLGGGEGLREWFPRGESLVYVKGPGGRIEGRRELESSGLADAAVSLSGPLGQSFGGSHRWVAALELPTGKEGTLAGSGGWDWGLRWFGLWERGKSSFTAAAGYTWLDQRGGWLGLPRANTWHLLGDWRRPVSSRTMLRVCGRLDSSPIADLRAGAASQSAFFLTLGVTVRVASGAWIALDLGENAPTKGVAPDYSLSLRLGASRPPLH